MKKRQIPPRVFFNASVIIAGLISPTGGSAKLLKWAKSHKVRGLISEIILQEVKKHKNKIGQDEKEIEKRIDSIFFPIVSRPENTQVEEYRHITTDYGDAHVLASSIATKSKFLVTLDQKHLLILQKKFKKVKIVSPKQLIEMLSR